MAYTPINLHAFTAAYSGAISGMAVSGWITNPTPANYLLVTQIAGAFAQAFDQAWNNPVVNELDEFSILSACQNEFIGRGPGPLTNPVFHDPTNWAVPAAACAALVLEGDAYFTAQGITPFPWPPIIGTGTLIFATIGQLEAFNAGSLQQGQLALVLSNLSLWNLAVGFGDTTVDNITIASVTNPPFSTAFWIRFASTGIALYQAQASWFIDPQNVSGLASDQNPGLDATQPLLTKAELFRRWGYTWSPTFDGINVIITYMSSDIALTDPGSFAPNFVNGGSLTHTAAIPAATFTGTLNVVTPKNVPGNQSLAASFNTTTGAITIGQLLMNSTRANSLAWVAEGGPVFNLSQPCDPFIFGNSPAPSEEDTWAGGDAITGFPSFIQINMAFLGGTVSASPGGGAASHVVHHLNIIDPTGGGNVLDIDGRGNVALVEAIITRPHAAISDGFQNTSFSNCNIGSGNVNAPDQVVQYQAGLITGTIGGSNGAFINNLYLLGLIDMANVAIGSVYTSLGVTILCNGGFHAVTSSADGALYGKGTLDVLAGALQYNTGAVISMPLSGGLRIGTSPNAYSNHTPGGVGTTTTVSLVALSAAALDAGAGPAGFGGLAYIPGVGSITLLGSAP